tara:strand:+ start:45 stop:197 length:153 start_codon:yes stop_codon:yes gene_type:complete
MMKVYLNNFILYNPVPSKLNYFSKIIPKVVYVIKKNKKNRIKKNISDLNL